MWYMCFTCGSSVVNVLHVWYMCVGLARRRCLQGGVCESTYGVIWCHDAVSHGVVLLKCVSGVSTAAFIQVRTTDKQVRTARISQKTPGMETGIALTARQSYMLTSSGQNAGQYSDRHRSITCLSLAVCVSVSLYCTLASSSLSACVSAADCSRRFATLGSACVHNTTPSAHERS